MLLGYPLVLGAALVLGYCATPFRRHQGLDIVRYLAPGGACLAVAVGLVVLFEKYVGAFSGFSAALRDVALYPTLSETGQKQFQAEPIHLLAAAMLSGLALSLAVITRHYVARRELERWRDEWSFTREGTVYTGEVTRLREMTDGTKLAVVVVTKVRVRGEWHNADLREVVVPCIDLSRTAPPQNPDRPSVKRVSAEVFVRPGVTSQRTELLSEGADRFGFLGSAELPTLGEGGYVSLIAEVDWREKMLEKRITLVSSWRPEIEVLPAPGELRGAAVLDEGAVRSVSLEERLRAHLERLQGAGRRLVTIVNENHLKVHAIPTSEGRCRVYVAWWPDGVRQAMEKEP